MAQQRRSETVYGFLRLPDGGNLTGVRGASQWLDLSLTFFNQVTLRLHRSWTAEMTTGEGHWRCPKEVSSAASLRSSPRMW